MTQARRGATAKRRTWILGGAGALVLAAAAYAYFRPFDAGGEGASGKVATVQHGRLVINVTESGTVKNLEQVVIKSEVEGRAAILTLVPEGTHVKPGDLLVELDSSKLVDQRSAQQITVINTEASYVRAREGLAVAKNQAESDITRAELDFKFAEIDLEKYVQGEYPQAQQQAEADITIAREEVERAADKLKWSEKLHEQRYLSLMELRADQLALKKAELNLELAQSRKEVLEKYSHRRQIEGLQSAVEQANLALDRVRRLAAADLKQAEADLKARESEYNRQKLQLEKIEEQIRKCKIFAPVKGMVVYATTGRGSWRGNEDPLEEGQEVRERQELIFLPTAASMMAEVMIHESALEKVKVGMPAQVTVDAAGGRTYNGRVAKIAPLPDAFSARMNPDLKVYQSEIHIDGDASNLRSGMSCRAEIVVETYEDAVYVPIQSVVRVKGRPTVYVVRNGGAEPRTVELGLDNNRVVRILDGIEPGEEVLLAPPLASGAVSTESAGGDDRAPAKGGGDRAPADATGAGQAEPEAKPAAGGASEDGSSMSREERRKRMENMSPEEREKLREQWRNGGGRPGRSGGGD